MAQKKYYFRNEDESFCFPLQHHLEEAREERINEVILMEAIPNFHNPEYVWCSDAACIEDKSQCNKYCDGYNPVRGKGCASKGHLFVHGNKVIFDVNTGKEIKR